MLGKLMKYEWVTYYKKVLIAIAYLAGAGVFLYMMFLFGGMDEYNDRIWVQAALVGLYIFSVFAIIYGTAIYLIYRFYKSVYEDEGYLLHTLPVNKHQILWAKALMGWAIVLLEGAAVCLVVLLLSFVSMARIQDFSVFRDFLELLGDLWDMITKNGIAGVLNALLWILSSVLGAFRFMFRVSAAISLGQASNNHKLLSSLGAYLLLGIVTGIINSMFLGSMVGMNSMMGMIFKMDEDLVWISLVENGLFAGLFYFISWYMMEHRLNLE